MAEKELEQVKSGIESLNEKLETLQTTVPKDKDLGQIKSGIKNLSEQLEVLKITVPKDEGKNKDDFEEIKSGIATLSQKFDTFWTSLPNVEDQLTERQLSTSHKKELQDSEWLKECQKRLRMIYATKSKVKIIPWDQGSAVDIDEIYTQLSWLKDHRKLSGVTKTKLQSYTEIFKHGKRILVYGRPGIGKTVFTKKAAFDWSQQRSQATIGTFDLVLLIRLRDVCNLHDVPSILKASQLLASDGLISIEDLYDYVVRHQEKVLLILDGYDEYIYSSENQSPVDEIWKRNQLSGCCVIVTSKEMKTDELRDPSDAQFEVNGFDDERQREFARRFLGDEDSVQKFLFYLRQKNLIDLAEIPLLLLTLCLLWKEKDRKALQTKRVHIFTQFVETLFNHMRGKQSAGSVFMKEDYTAELYALGRLAFEALLQDCLYFPFSKLPEHELIERLIEVGLFRVSNMSSLKPEKGVYFIHKSVQEYLAASFLKEELISNKSEKKSLLKVDSIENIFKMREMLIFASEWSEEAAREIVIHLTGMAAKKEGLTEYSFDNESPRTDDLSEEQRNYLNLCTQLLFYCSEETRKELLPTFLSSLGGVLVINPKQLNVTVTENLLKTAAPLMYIFSSYSDEYTEQDYRNLITLTQQLNAVIVGCSGEMRASEFLKKYPWRSAKEFFLKKERRKTHVYFSQIDKSLENGFPFHMLNALISLVEATKKTKINPGGESSEQACSTTHGLSRVWRIDAWDVNRSKEELLSDVIPFVLAPQWIRITGEYGAKLDSDMAKKMLSAINPTHKLEILTLRRLNIRSSAAGFIARILTKSPNLEFLNLSLNPLLGEGVDAIAKHLGSTPHLRHLWLDRVKMTKQQVQHLSIAVKHSSITHLGTDYHDHYGNPKPEHEWTSEEEKGYLRPLRDSSSESGNKEEQDHYGNPKPIHKWPSEEYCGFGRGITQWPKVSGNKEEQDHHGNPKPEHKWPPEEYWGYLRPLRDSSSESGNKEEQTSFQDCQELGRQLSGVIAEELSGDAEVSSVQAEDDEIEPEDVESQGDIEEVSDEVREEESEGGANKKGFHVFRKLVTSEGAHWAVSLGAVHLMFPPNAVSEPTSVEVHRWKYSVRSPPLQEHEAITSNVIELSSMDGQHLKFNTKVKLSLSHSATDLRGYELVIKRLVDRETNKWEDVDGTRDIRCLQEMKDHHPSHMEIPNSFFPIAQTDITECSTYAVVCRLKSSPTYTITANGGSFIHPDFPGVTVTIPENAVDPNAEFPLELKVQEVPSDEFQDEEVLIGPILRISCCEVVQFVRPVTIQLPISLRGQQDLNKDSTTCRVRVLFLKSDGTQKEWIEISDDLVGPASFDGEFVRFPVKRFSGYSPSVDRRKENSSVNKGRLKRFMNRFICGQPRPAIFIAYFEPGSSTILSLVCCDGQLKQQVIKELKEEGIKPRRGSSKKNMIPEYDKAFVVVSGGIRPFSEEEMKDCYVRLHKGDLPFYSQLEVCVEDATQTAQVKFRNSGLWICTLNLPIPTQNTEPTQHVTAPSQSEEHCAVSARGAVKKGSPTDDVLQYLSAKIPDKWKPLGRRLGFHEAELDGFDQKEQIREKAYAMLLAWIQKDASGATYSVLYEALRHQLVKRSDLAETFCCD